MAVYKILTWHGIPVQVRAQDSDGRVSKKLDDRFMDAVDKAAMASKRADGDSYADGFVWSEGIERAGTAEEVASAVVRELAAAYTDIDYRALATRLRAESGGLVGSSDLPE
jgi:hypothetical protein